MYATLDGKRNVALGVPKTFNNTLQNYIGIFLKSNTIDRQYIIKLHKIIFNKTL